MRIIFFVCITLWSWPKDFICGEIDELLEMRACSCEVEDVHRAHDIIQRKQGGILDRAIDMARCGQVQNILWIPEAPCEVLINRGLQIVPLELDTMLIRFVIRKIADSV
jgi:hypothetical protein